MQFVELHLETKPMMSLIRAIPEQWWKNGINSLSSLFGFLHGAGHEVLARYATEVSTSIGRHWISEQMEKAGADRKMFKPQLVNCMVSEERLVTISIPLSFKQFDKFYQLRVEPIGVNEPGKKFSVRFFYPQESGAVRWYGRLAAHMTYNMDIGAQKVCVDGEWVTVKAWSAMAALLMAQGQEDGGEVGILMDMARDGEI